MNKIVLIPSRLQSERLPEKPLKLIGNKTMIEMVYEAASKSVADKVTIAKHNIDNEPNTPTKFGIRGIPTMLLFKDGELKAQKIGATTKSNIVSWIEENI